MGAHAATALVLVLAVGLAAPQALAQGCTEAEPCPFLVDIREDGLHGYDGARWTFSVGEWVELNVSNTDERFVDHTLTLDGYGVTLEVPALSEAGVRLRLDQAGTFLLHDDEGRQGNLTVVAGDVNDYEQGLVDASGNPVSAADGTGNRTTTTTATATADATDRPAPTVPAMVTLTALAAMALARRRTTNGAP